MQTISTRYLGPTNTKGSRIVAKTSGGGHKITLSYDYALNDDKNHMKAAQELMKKAQWSGRMIGGHTKDGMVFVVGDMSFMDYSISNLAN